MTVAVRQAAAIEPGHVVDATPVASPAARLPEPRDDEAIRLTVAYNLREYLAILREFMPVQMLEWERSRGRRPGRGLSWSSRLALALLVPLVGTPAFLLKKRRLPICRFTIDASGIQRRARGDRLRVAWNEVVEVHRLKDAWLVAMRNGAMPLPHRCFNATQRVAFERLLALRRDAGCGGHGPGIVESCNAMSPARHDTPV